MKGPFLPFQLVLVIPKDIAMPWPIPGWTEADYRIPGASSRHKSLPKESQRAVPRLNEKPEGGSHQEDSLTGSYCSCHDSSGR